jgi:hypothetical protein
MTQNNMEVVELIEALRDGVPRCGLHDDNTTELFDIEDANDAMYRAAEALTSAQSEIERLAKERDALREALDSARNLPITDAELVRMNNSAAGTDEVRISSRMLLLLVGLAMSTRSALQPLEPKND